MARPQILPVPLTLPVPARLYHGTGEDFERFDPDRGNPRHPDGLGIWLTEDEATARDFARERGGPDGIVLVAEGTLRNPYVVDSFETLKRLVRDCGNQARQARAFLVAHGHDGIVIDRSYPDGVADDRRDVIFLSGEGLAIVERLPLAPPPTIR